MTTVANHLSHPGTYDDLRGFLLDHAGHRVVVEVDAHNAMDRVAVFRAEGILKPVTLPDHERELQQLDRHMTEAGYDGYEDIDHSDDLAYSFAHYADFELVDRAGTKTASMVVWDHAVRDVTIGLHGQVVERRGEETVVTREYADFCLEVLRWDCAHPDEDGTPGELPSQLIRVRVERWVEQPLAAASTQGTPAA
jgi:hypothetical protein